jgi:hypothetical protein
VGPRAVLDAVVKRKIRLLRRNLPVSIAERSKAGTVYDRLNIGIEVRILLGAWMCVRVFLCCVVLCR